MRLGSKYKQSTPLESWDAVPFQSGDAVTIKWEALGMVNQSQFRTGDPRPFTFLYKCAPPMVMLRDTDGREDFVQADLVQSLGSSRTG